MPGWAPSGLGGAPRVGGSAAGLGYRAGSKAHPGQGSEGHPGRAGLRGGALGGQAPRGRKAAPGSEGPQGPRAPTPLGAGPPRLRAAPRARARLGEPSGAGSAAGPGEPSARLPRLAPRSAGPPTYLRAIPRGPICLDPQGIPRCYRVGSAGLIAWLGQKPRRCRTRRKPV